MEHLYEKCQRFYRNKKKIKFPFFSTPNYYLAMTHWNLTKCRGLPFYTRCLDRRHLTGKYPKIKHSMRPIFSCVLYSKFVSLGSADSQLYCHVIFMWRIDSIQYFSNVKFMILYWWNKPGTILTENYGFWNPRNFSTKFVLHVIFS